jgi:hypothetical protein
MPRTEEHPTRKPFGWLWRRSLARPIGQGCDFRATMFKPFGLKVTAVVVLSFPVQRKTPGSFLPGVF